jgi:hypothetical protein
MIGAQLKAVVEDNEFVRGALQGLMKEAGSRHGPSHPQKIS